MSSRLDRIIREVLSEGGSTLLEADMSRRLDMLVRQGMMPASQLPILKRGLERFNQGKVPAPNERNAVNTLLNAMMFIVLGDDTVFNRARTSVQQKKYQTEDLEENCKSEEDFKPHMMYDPKTGKGVKAETYEDHVKLDKRGYTHEKPDVKEEQLDEYGSEFARPAQKSPQATAQIKARMKAKNKLRPKGVQEDWADINKKAFGTSSQKSKVETHPNKHHIDQNPKGHQHNKSNADHASHIEKHMKSKGIHVHTQVSNLGGTTGSEHKSDPRDDHIVIQHKNGGDDSHQITVGGGKAELHKPGRDGKKSIKYQGVHHTDQLHKFIKDNEHHLKEERIISEAYKTGHKSYTDAVNHALDHHKKGGLESSADDRAQHIGLDSKKPGEGKTTRVNLPAKDKSGKKHMVHMQVYNKGGSHPYELNTYSSTTKALQKEEQLDEYGSMRSDKSSHNTGGMRISNADAADARERAVKKSAEKRASLAGERAKQKSAEKRDKLSNIIKKNTIQKGPMKGYMTDETNQGEQQMKIDWSKNPFAQAKAMKEGAFKRMATADAEEERLKAEKKAKRLTAKKGKEEKETDPGFKEEMNEADHWSKDKTFHPTNTYHKHSAQFLKDKKAGKVTDMGRLKKSAQTGKLANPLAKHAESDSPNTKSSAELKSMKEGVAKNTLDIYQAHADKKKKDSLKVGQKAPAGASKANERQLSSIAKQMNKAVTRANAKLKEDLYGLPELDDMDLEMQENYQSPTKNNYSDKELRQAKGIAFDKRYKGGNMTGAAKAMEKIKKGLSDHPVASKALRKANEEYMKETYLDQFDGVESMNDIYEMSYKEKFQAMLKKTGKKLSDMSDEDKKKFFNKVDDNHDAVNENKAFRDAARDYAKDDKRGLAPTKKDAPKVSDAKNAKEIEHIVPQMRKALSVGKKVQFKDGKHHEVSKAHAAKFLNKYMSGKPADKEKMQSHAHASHKNFSDHVK